MSDGVDRTVEDVAKAILSGGGGAPADHLDRVPGIVKHSEVTATAERYGEPMVRAAVEVVMSPTDTFMAAIARCIRGDFGSAARRWVVRYVDFREEDGSPYLHDSQRDYSPASGPTESEVGDMLREFSGLTGTMPGTLTLSALTPGPIPLGELGAFVRQVRESCIRRLVDAPLGDGASSGGVFTVEVDGSAEFEEVFRFTRDEIEKAQSTAQADRDAASYN